MSEHIVNRPFISVIIPSYNEEDHIAFCIRSIQNCSYPKDKMEIILVDNGSTDNTLNIAKNFNINIIVDESKTIGGLRNLGVQASKGEILGFIDADCTVSSDWMIRADYILRDKQIGITGSRLKTSNEGNWVEEAWALHLNSRVQQDGIVKYINSGNCVLRREVFDVVGGFSETLVTDEDVDLCEKVRALGYCIYHCEDITAIHWGYPKTIRQFFKREIWHGIGDSKRNIVSFWKSRPLLISFFNILLLILALISLVIRSALLLLFLTFLLILPCFLLAVKTSSKTKVYRHLPSLIILYCLYGTARTISLLAAVIQILKEQSFK